MPKKRKIGFDKLPGPIVDSFVPLQDYITGEILRDDVGNPIVTEERGTLPQLARSDQAMSVVVNTTSSTTTTPLKVVEAFPETSAVSNSLLGVPRAETQLSLFSDVSTYGLDKDNWEYYRFSSPIYYPSEWYSRENPVFGRREQVTFNEATKEQALYLRAYPVQYTYPYGPKDTRRYNANLFNNYLNFVAIGKILYNYFADIGFVDFAEENFINDDIIIIDESDQEVQGYEFSTATLGLIDNNGSFYDVRYGTDLRKSFDTIERFTLAYNRIIGEIFSYPVINSNVNFLNNSIKAARDRVSPGYSFRGTYYGVLESRQTFRYQPGRISGFTFGVRSKTDTTTNENFIEWGCANDSDQYVFQIRGSEFNIVRRSTIPLPENTLKRMGLPTTSQTATPIRSQSLENAKALYELVIKRDQFNGDKLDFSGDSGYQVKFEKVTMFKIEFGWYGAIGAKFYAYVPVKNDEARWVLIHTLVIENGVGEPCLQNPDFKFRYSLSVTNTANVSEPLYIYKYGASYYIDGGDEGTLYMKSTASEIVEFESNTPVLTLHTKNFIDNSNGVQIKNRKKIYPTSISANSTETVKISIKEHIASPDGYHYFYAPSLHNTVSEKSRTVELELNTLRNEVTILNDEVFTQKDNNSKIIADGIYNSYISYNNNDTIAKLKRRVAYNLQENKALGEKSLGLANQEIDLSNYKFTARLTNYDTIAASDVPITERFFKIHFLNPIITDNRNYAEFVISLTDKKPSIVNDQLKFDVENTDGGLDYNFDEEISVEWSQYEEQLNIDGKEISDWDPTYGYLMEIDPRLPRPPGSDSGRISVIVGNIIYRDYEYESAEIVNQAQNLYDLIFTSQSDAPFIEETDITNEIDLGINETTTGVIVQSIATPVTQIINGINVTKYKIRVRGDISELEANNKKFQVKNLTLEDGWTVESYNADNTPRFASKTILVSKKIKFSSSTRYLVIGLRDKARVNNIVVEELSQLTTYAHTPNWLSSTPEIVVFSGGSSMNLTPASFQQIERLSGIRYDSQLLQPLRPGEEIYSFFVEPGDTSPIKLSNIFERDRKTITTGLYNNRVVVFTANRVGSNPVGNIEIGVSLKEQ